GLEAQPEFTERVLLIRLFCAVPHRLGHGVAIHPRPVIGDAKPGIGPIKPQVHADRGRAGCDAVVDDVGHSLRKAVAKVAKRMNQTARGRENFDSRYRTRHHSAASKSDASQYIAMGHSEHLGFCDVQVERPRECSAALSAGTSFPAPTNNATASRPSERHRSSSMRLPVRRATTLKTGVEATILSSLSPIVRTTASSEGPNDAA